MGVFKKVELQPIQVPNYVFAYMPPGRKQDGWQEGVKFHITELDEETVIALADDFKANLLKKFHAPRSSE